MTTIIGPNFYNELFAAGLGGLPFSWSSSDGTITYGPSITDAQKSAIEAVLAAHDPTKPDTTAGIAALTAACAATITAALTSSTVVDWSAYRQTCLAQLATLTAALAAAGTIEAAQAIVWTAPSAA